MNVTSEHVVEIKFKIGCHQNCNANPASHTNVVNTSRQTVSNERPTSVNGFMQMAYNREEFNALATFFTISGRARLVSIDMKHFEQAGWETLPQVKVRMAIGKQ